MISESNRRLARNTAMLYVRMLMVMIVGLYTSRVVLHALGVTDFGINNVVAGFVMMFTFMNNSLGNASSRFITFHLGKGNETRLVSVVRTSIFIHIIFGLIIVVLLETLGMWIVTHKLVIPPERMPAAKIIFHFAVVSSAMAVVQVPLRSMVIAHEKMSFYAYIGIFEAFAKLVTAFAISHTTLDRLAVYGALNLLWVIITVVAMHIFCRVLFSEYKPNLHYEASLLKEMLSYTGWSLLGSLATMMKNQGINVVLNIFFGPTVNAAKGISDQVNFAVSSFTQNFTTAINPQIIKNYASKDIPAFVNLTYRGAKFSFFLLLILSLPLIFEADFVLSIWLVDVPDYAIIFTKLILIVSLIESFTYAIGTSIQATGKIKWYQIIVSGVVLLNIPISMLILWLGYPPQSTLLVTIIVGTIAVYSRIAVIRANIPEFGIRSFLRKVFLPSGIVTIVSITPPLLSQIFIKDQNWISFIIISSVCTISTTVAIYCFGLGKAEKALIIQLMHKHITKHFARN